MKKRSKDIFLGIGLGFLMFFPTAWILGALEGLKYKCW